MAVGSEGRSYSSRVGPPNTAIKNALMCSGTILEETNAEMLEMPPKCACWEKSVALLILCLIFVFEILKMVFTPRKLILMAQITSYLSPPARSQDTFSSIQIPCDYSEESHLIIHRTKVACLGHKCMVLPSCLNLGKNSLHISLISWHWVWIAWHTVLN